MLIHTKKERGEDQEVDRKLTIMKMTINMVTVILQDFDLDLLTFDPIRDPEVQFQKGSDKNGKYHSLPTILQNHCSFSFR